MSSSCIVPQLFVHIEHLNGEHIAWIPLRNGQKSPAAAVNRLRELNRVLLRQQVPHVPPARIEHADPTAVVGDQYVALQVDSDAAWAAQLPPLDGPFSDDVARGLSHRLRRVEEELSGSVEDLDATVSAVRHDDVVAGVDGHMIRVAKLGILGASGAEDLRPLAVHLVDADRIVEGVRDDQLTAAIDRNPVRPAELTLSDVHDGLPRRGEDLNALALAVRHRDVSLSRYCYSQRLDLALCECLQRSSVLIEDLELVVAVGDVIVLGNDDRLIRKKGDIARVPHLRYVASLLLHLPQQLRSNEHRQQRTVRVGAGR